MNNLYPKSSDDCFSIDAEQSHGLCLSAKETMFDNSEQSVSWLVEALLLRPSNMLAYQLLSEVFDATDRPDDAEMCRKGKLPEESLPTCDGVAGDRVVESSVLSAAGEQRTILYSAESISLPRPGSAESLRDIPRPPFFDEQIINAKPCFIDCISHGVLWHDSFHTCVFNACGAELKEHTKADLLLIDSLMSNYKPYDLSGRVFLIGARGAHNFYHWLADIAPKLGVLLRAGYRFNSDDRFVVPFARQKFTHQILSQFGVSKDQLVETENQYAFLHAEELIVPFVDNKMGLTMGRWVPEVLRENFLPCAEIAGKRRLFVIRESQAADGRQIENQTGLLEILQLFGFECVTPEKLPVVQQAVLFAEAEIVVAAHGAALGNLMFCSSGAVVVEFYAGHLAPCYRAISALLGLDYYQVYCGHSSKDEPPGAQQNQSARRSANLSVPLAEVEALLAGLLD